MPRLTPQQLQDARRRSGKHGGRPANPSVAEARTAALERLVPKALRVLEAHLDSGRPDAWRSAYRILEHSWGRPPEHLDEIPTPTDIDPMGDEILGRVTRSALSVAPKNGGIEEPELPDGTRTPPQSMLSEANLDLLALLIFVELVRESAEHGQSRLLVLDDVLQSVDTPFRHKFVEYLITEFADWQLIFHHSRPALA